MQGDEDAETNFADGLLKAPSTLLCSPPLLNAPSMLAGPSMLPAPSMLTLPSGMLDVLFEPDPSAPPSA